MFYRLLTITIVFLLFINGCGEDNSSTTEKENMSTEEASKVIPVEAMNVEEKIVEQTLPLTGVLQPNNEVDIVAEVSGKVTEIKKQLGSYVKANEILANIDDVIPESQFKQAEAHLLSTESNLDIAEANFKSDKILFENNDISELEYNNSQLALKNAKSQHLSAVAALSAAQKTFEDTKIKSPISGFISRKNIDLGTMVNIGSVVYRVVDISKLKLNTYVSQETINRVKIGDKAIIHVSALNGNSFNGYVKRISPQADENTGGFEIEISVTNKDRKIKAGMTAKVELMLSKEQKAISVPEYALVSKDEEHYVYKIKDDFAELTKVTLGETVGQNVVIDKGLNIGDKIVTVGMKNLGVKTKVKIEKLH